MITVMIPLTTFALSGKRKRTIPAAIGNRIMGYRRFIVFPSYN
jgi:hypothetical protein